ncbi:MAG: DUF4352 domain-containing protein [Thermoprotei archaeon]
MKAISPVIATVIIVAVAIAISIAVALWITGLTSAFTGVEKIEVVNAYADSITLNDTRSWNVTLVVKNTGTKPATIDGIFINNRPGDISKANITNNSWTLNPGDTRVIAFYLTSNTTAVPETIIKSNFTSGQTISIVIHTASGGQYPASVTLP